MYLVWMPAPSRFVNVLRSGAYLSLCINKACVLVGLAEGADICAVIVEVISVVEMVNTVAFLAYISWEYYCLKDHRPAGEDGDEMRLAALEVPLMGTPKSPAAPAAPRAPVAPAANPAAKPAFDEDDDFAAPSPKLSARPAAPLPLARLQIEL